jgi:hypothetical protein
MHMKKLENQTTTNDKTNTTPSLTKTRGRQLTVEELPRVTGGEYRWLGIHP